MRSLAQDLSDLTHGWALPVALVALTFVAAGLFRLLARRVANVRHLRLLRDLAPALSWLIVLVGLRMSSDAMPLPTHLERWVSGAFYVASVLVLLSLVRRAAYFGLEWSALRTHASNTMVHGFVPLLRNLVTFFIAASGGILVLQHFGYDVFSLLAALGVGSLAVGLAAKETLSNMISGFTLIIDRNLRPGDRVSLGGFTGDVEEIGLRSTRIRIGNGSTLIVPNADMVNNKILNLSQPTRSLACSTTLRVPMAVPFDQIREICLGVIAQIPAARRDKGGWVNLSSLADGMQQIGVGFWIQDLDQEGGALSELHQRVLRELSARDIPLLGPPPLAPRP
jgi:small-conductance mechanosensitive channel